MYSILTVTAIAGSYDLTTVAAVKAELGIGGSTEDANLATWITQASADIAGYCNRVFPKETVKEVYRPVAADDRMTLTLHRMPVPSIASVVENGTTLDPSFYEVDPSTGLLARLDSNDCRMRWAVGKITVIYDGGYATLPADLARATVTQVKFLRFNATTDPTVRRDQVDGVSSVEYFQMAAAGAEAAAGALPAPVRLTVDRYRITPV